MSSLTAPALSPSLDGVPEAGPTAPERRCRKRLALAVVAIAGVLAGAVGSGVLVTAAFLSAAEDIGRGMSEGIGSVRDTLTHPDDPTGSAAVDRFTAVAPGDLGADSALDVDAQSCFAGDLTACDDLWSSAPPLSAYEQYAETCGGRVKPDAVSACTDLE